MLTCRRSVCIAPGPQRRVSETLIIIHLLVLTEAGERKELNRTVKEGGSIAIFPNQ